MTALPRARRSGGWPVGRIRSWVGLPALVGVGVAVGVISMMRGSELVEGVLIAAFTSVFIALAWIDLERRVIPNSIVYPALGLAIAFSGAWPDRGPAEALTGGLGAFAVWAAISGLGRGGLGGGDVKMATLVGAVVGYPAVLSAGLVTALAGGFIAAVPVVQGRAGKGEWMPYSPFITLGAVVALVQ